MFTATVTSANLLKEEVQFVSRAIPGKSWAGPDSQRRIILYTERGQLRLTGSDREYRQATRAVALHGQAGELRVAVKPEDLLAALKGWQPTYKSLVIEHNGVLKLGETVVPCEAADVPDLLPEAEEVAFTVPQEDLRAAFTAIAPALCRDETRPVLTGARLTTGVQGVELAATDMYRLTTYRLKTARGEGMMLTRRVIVPGDLIRLFLEHQPDLRGNCVPATFALSDETITLSTDTVILTGRLAEGEFPNVERMIRSENASTRVLPAKLLGEAVRAVLPIAHRDAERVQVVFGDASRERGFPTGELTATARDDNGTVCVNTREVGLLPSRDPWEGFVNGEYLAEAADLFGEGEVEIGTHSPLAPIQMTSQEFPGVHVLMPMQGFGADPGGRKA